MRLQKIFLIFQQFSGGGEAGRPAKQWRECQVLSEVTKISESSRCLAVIIFSSLQQDSLRTNIHLGSMRFNLFCRASWTKACAQSHFTFSLKPRGLEACEVQRHVVLGLLSCLLGCGVLPIGPKAVPFWGSYLEFYKVIPKRNYFGPMGNYI